MNQVSRIFSKSILNQSLLNYVVCVWVIMMTTACQKQNSNNDELKAVETIIENNIEWFKNKDFKLSYSTMSNGPDLFLFQLDSKSTINGFEEFKKFSEVWKNPDVKYGGHKFYDLKITISRLGDAAWFHCMLEDCSKYKDNPVRCFTTRYSGVLEKREGRWILIEQHFSVPADQISDDWEKRVVHAPSDI